MEQSEDFLPAIDEKELQEGKMNLVSVDGFPVLFIKQKGKIFVIDNRCPHQSCALSGGSLAGFILICPCHDWRFDLLTGQYEEDPELKLIMIEWKVVSGKIWVKLPE